MTDELLNALQDCLQALRQGETLETALARYPQLAAELRPLLITAQLAPRLGQVAGQPAAPAPATEAAHRAQFLGRATALRPTLRPATLQKFPLNLFSHLWPTPSEATMRPPISFAVRAALIIGLVIFGLVAGGYGMASASAASLPGDPLYGIKRALEDTQYFFADAQTRTRLETEFADRRLQEVAAVADSGRTELIEFSGWVERQEAEVWIVSGMRVAVNAQTVVVGNPVVGSRVRVVGTIRPDRTVLAARIVRLDDEPPLPTATERPPEVTRTPGATEPTREVTRTPEPTRTEVHEVTNTPRPEPSRTPFPEPSRTRTPRPEPSRTPEPTRTRTPRPEPSRTYTPRPEPSRTPVPEPSRTPEATQPPEPSRTPEPTQPPEPSRTPTRPVEPSRTPTAPVEPSRTPTRPVEPSRTPTVPVEPSRTPTRPVEPSRTPTVPVEPSRTPTMLPEPSRTPEPTNTPGVFAKRHT